MFPLFEFGIEINLVLYDGATRINIRSGKEGCRSWTAYLCEILEEFFSTESLCDLDQLVIILSKGVLSISLNELQGDVSKSRPTSEPWKRGSRRKICFDNQTVKRSQLSVKVIRSEVNG